MAAEGIKESSLPDYAAGTEQQRVNAPDLISVQEGSFALAGCLPSYSVREKLMKLIALVGIVFAITVNCVHAQPSRADGLSVHLLPDNVAALDSTKGGFIVTDPTSHRRQTYPAAPELLSYFDGLSADARSNGIWVVYTNPDAYSEEEKAKLKSLVVSCVTKKVPIFTCRASDLPTGWKAGKAIED